MMHQVVICIICNEIRTFPSYLCVYVNSEFYFVFIYSKCQKGQIYLMGGVAKRGMYIAEWSKIHSSRIRPKYTEFRGKKVFY